VAAARLGLPPTYTSKIELRTTRWTVRRGGPKARPLTLYVLNGERSEHPQSSSWSLIYV
jgi:hypothetical protein